MGIHNKEYDILFFYPGPVGFMAAHRLATSGMRVLAVSLKGKGHAEPPDCLGASAWFPEQFNQNLLALGLPDMGPPCLKHLALYIGDTFITAEPGYTNQLLSLSKAAPRYDTRLMSLFDKIHSTHHRLHPRLEKTYFKVSSKKELGGRLNRGNQDDPFKGIAEDGPGLIARWAFLLPGYLSLGLEGASSGMNALAAGYGMRCPHIGSVDFHTLSLESEYLYMNGPGDYVEVSRDADIEVDFDGGPAGRLEIDGTDIGFRIAMMEKDIAADVFQGRTDLYEKLHGLSLISAAFSWKAPKKFIIDGKRHGMVMSDPGRPPVNDNLVFFSIHSIGEDVEARLGVVVERGEMLSPAFAEKRRRHLVARMAANFITAVGGELKLIGPIDPPAMPEMTFHGRGGFRFYDGGLAPGQTVEDLPKLAMWIASRIVLSARR